MYQSLRPSQSYIFCTRKGKGRWAQNNAQVHRVVAQVHDYYIDTHVCVSSSSELAEAIYGLCEIARQLIRAKSRAYYISSFIVPSMARCVYETPYTIKCVVCSVYFWKVKSLISTIAGTLIVVLCLSIWIKYKWVCVWVFAWDMSGSGWKFVSDKRTCWLSYIYTFDYRFPVVRQTSKVFIETRPLSVRNGICIYDLLVHLGSGALMKYDATTTINVQSVNLIGSHLLWMCCVT